MIKPLMRNRWLWIGLALLAMSLVLIPWSSLWIENWTRHGNLVFQIYRTQFSLAACLPLLAGVPLFAAWIEHRIPAHPWRALLLTMLFAEIAGLAAFGFHLKLILAGYSDSVFREYSHLLPWRLLAGLACGSLLYALVHIRRKAIARMLWLGAGIAALAGYWIYLIWPEVGTEAYERVTLAIRTTHRAWLGTLLLFFGAAIYGALRRMEGLYPHRPAWPTWLMSFGALSFLVFKPAYPAHVSLSKLEKNPNLSISWAGVDEAGHLYLQANVTGVATPFDNGAVLLLRSNPQQRRLTLVRRALADAPHPPFVIGENPFDKRRVTWVETASPWRQLFYDQSRCEIVSLKSGRAETFRRVKLWEKRYPHAPFCRAVAFGPGRASAYWDAEARTLRGITPEGKSFSRSLPVGAPPRMLSTPQGLLFLTDAAGDEVSSVNVSASTRITRIAWNNEDLQVSELPGKPAQLKTADTTGGAAFALHDPVTERETWYGAETPAFTKLDSGADLGEIMLPVWNGSSKPAWLPLSRLSLLLQGSAYGFDRKNDSFSARVVAGRWLIEQDRYHRPLALIELNPELLSGQTIAAISTPVDWQTDSAVFLTHRDKRQQVVRYFPATGQSELMLDLPDPPGLPIFTSLTQTPQKFELTPITPAPPNPIVPSESPAITPLSKLNPCKTISKLDRDHLAYHLPELHPSGFVRCGTGMGPVRWKTPAATEACIWHLLGGCQPGEEDVLCAQSKLRGGAGTLLGDLQFNLPACDIIRKGAPVIYRIDDAESRVNFCMSIVLMGGPIDCLTRLRSEIVNLIRPPVYPLPSGYRFINLISYISQFAGPKYRHLDPWLRSLPASKSSQFNSLVAAVLAFHEGDRGKLMNILAKDSEPSTYSIVIWLKILAPKADLAREAENLGASHDRLEAIRKAVESLRLNPDQIKHSVAPYFHYCDPGVNPCHDETRCIELLYAGASSTPTCTGRPVYSTNHCPYDVICTACARGKTGETDCTDVYAFMSGKNGQSSGRFSQCEWSEAPKVKCTLITDPPSCRAP